MNHSTSGRFWKCYDALPTEIQTKAKKNYQTLQIKHDHRSLHFKKLKGNSDLWSIRIGHNYRAVGRKHDSGVVWFWIGSREKCEKEIAKRSK